MTRGPKITYENTLLTDRDVNFYTGIQSREIFDSLYDLLSQFVKRRWKGSVNIYRNIRKFKPSPSKFGPTRKLQGKDELLLTLMRLKLGLVRDHLANLFGISSTSATLIFNSWLTALDKVFVHIFLFWPDKEQVHVTKPARYRVMPGLRAIIDCSEIFIETPKDPKSQACTWSDYKHHNTSKFLIAVAPNSMIIFVSDIYGGRFSDKAITMDSNFLDKLDPYDILQADKGFNIRDECEARLITLHIPLGKRGQAQMSTSAVNKTKRVANLRIIVEQVIRRLKTFKIMKFEMPVTLIPNMDKIVRVCAALCNLRLPIYKN